MDGADEGGDRDTYPSAAVPGRPPCGAQARGGGGEPQHEAGGGRDDPETEEDLDYGSTANAVGDNNEEAPAI